MKLSKFHIVSIIATLLLLYFITGASTGQSSWWPVIIISLFYMAMLAIGSIFIKFNFYLISKNKLTVSPLGITKKIALTFDDGPAACTGRILDILKKEEVKAAFFVIGKNISGNEPVLKRMQQDGHAIGNHSYNHGFNFDWQSSAAMKREIEQTNDLIKNVTGNDTIHFRPPYGVTNPNLAKAIRKCKMLSIGWSLRSMDTVAKDRKKLLGKILSTIQDNDIILLHDHCAITADVLPELIRELKYRQYEFIQP